MFQADACQSPEKQVPNTQWQQGQSQTVFAQLILLFFSPGYPCSLGGIKKPLNPANLFSQGGGGKIDVCKKRKLQGEGQNTYFLSTHFVPGTLLAVYVCAC